MLRDVSTSASGKDKFAIGDDISVNGSVTTTGVEGRTAHIHTGAAGANGLVLVTLAELGDNISSVPPGAKLTAEQYESNEARKSYDNVHSAANPRGEVCGKLMPK